MPISCRAALVLLMLAGAALAAETPAAESLEPFVEVPTGVIVPASRAEREAEPCLVECGETYWTPSPAVIAELETKLRPHLEERLRSALSALDAVPAEKRQHSVQEMQVGHLRNVLGRLDQTARQYFGLVVGKTRWIHVAGLPREDHYEWRQRVAIVSDGGDWFWDASYRLDAADAADTAHDAPAGFVYFGWHGEA